MTREEKNQLLAEWLGDLKPTKEETEECLRERWSYIRRWTLHRRNNAPIENFSSYYWTPPDFYVSEEANALLLEKLATIANGDYGECFMLHRFSSGYWQASYLGVFCEHSKDRKTAICEAFLKWKSQARDTTVSTYHGAGR